MGENMKIIRHTYKVCKTLKTYTVFELETVSLINGNLNLIKPHFESILTDKIRIENFRSFSRGTGFNSYLRLRNANNWQQCEQVTGLFLTTSKKVFYGDRKQGQNRSFLVFQYSDDFSEVTIDYYVNLMPVKRDLKVFIQKYI